MNGIKRAVPRAVILFVLCAASSAPVVAQDDVAEIFAKTAIRVFDADHIDYDLPMAQAFSDHELAVLHANRDALLAMVEFALDRQDSVWGAKLAAYFGLDQTLPLLRYRLLVPKYCYGWEGPDYSELESHLADNQFQYSITYLEAIEAITGKPIAETITLTPAESKRIAYHAKSEQSEYYYWALWIQRKFGLRSG